MTEMFEDAELFLRHKYDGDASSQPKLTGPEAVAMSHPALVGSQMSLDKALKQVPSSDFRAWAVGLTKLALAQSEQTKQRNHGLEKRFFESNGKVEPSWRQGAGRDELDVCEVCL